MTRRVDDLDQLRHELAAHTGHRAPIRSRNGEMRSIRQPVRAWPLPHVWTQIGTPTPACSRCGVKFGSHDLACLGRPDSASG